LIAEYLIKSKEKVTTEEQRYQNSTRRVCPEGWHKDKPTYVLVYVLVSQRE
jgi:hypothetical protein